MAGFVLQAPFAVRTLAAPATNTELTAISRTSVIWLRPSSSGICEEVSVKRCGPTPGVLGPLHAEPTLLVSVCRKAHSVISVRCLGDWKDVDLHPTG